MIVSHTHEILIDGALMQESTMFAAVGSLLNSRVALFILILSVRLELSGTMALAFVVR